MLYLHQEFRDEGYSDLRDWITWLTESFDVEPLYYSKILGPRDAILCPSDSVSEPQYHPWTPLENGGLGVTGGRVIAVFTNTVNIRYAETFAAPDPLAALAHLHTLLTTQLFNSTHRIACDANAASLLLHLYNTNPLYRPYAAVQQMGVPQIDVLPFRNYDEGYPALHGPERLQAWNAFFVRYGIAATVKPDQLQHLIPRRATYDLSTGKTIYEPA